MIYRQVSAQIRKHRTFDIEDLTLLENNWIPYGIGLWWHETLPKQTFMTKQQALQKQQETN